MGRGGLHNGRWGGGGGLPVGKRGWGKVLAMLKRESTKCFGVVFVW